jgi:hypothetical protein
MDEYMPVEAGKIEIDVGYSAAFPYAYYDEDGKKQDFEAEVGPRANIFGLQLKFGIVENLDLEFSWAFEKDNDDLGDTYGFLPPELGLKYSLFPGKVAVFGNLVLPFVTNEYDTDPLLFSMGFEPGLVLNMASGPFQMPVVVSYTHFIENSDGYKGGDILNVFMKPGFAANNNLTLYLGANYLSFMESEGDGTGLEDDGYLFIIGPGWTYNANNRFALEANVPFTIVGENRFVYWGFSLMAYFTIGH